MKRQDMLSVIITFAVGFVAGGFLYVSHFAKLIQPDSVQTQEEAMEFTLESWAYGSCGSACPSYQILSNGAYTYRYTKTVGSPEEVKQGTVPFTVMRKVKGVLDSGELVAQSQPITPAGCNSKTGGIDIRYKVTFDGAEYTLDSCGTAVDGEGDLWNGLAEMWSYFKTVE